MDDLRTRAQLVAFDGAGAVGTVVTRAEVADAAAGPDFPATLQLELDRAESHASLAVDWDRGTLEQLLSSTDDDEIALWFHEPELAQAFDDVEGHGLRQRAAAIAVAATAAGATATPALARMAPGNEGGGGGTPAAAAVAQPAGAERGLQQDAQIAVTPTGDTSTTVTTTSGGSTLSNGELAAAVAGGALLISAAGFGAARRRTPPAQPA
jgi:hypothetical protein